MASRALQPVSGRVPHLGVVDIIIIIHELNNSTNLEVGGFKEVHVHVAQCEGCIAP